MYISPTLPARFNKAAIAVIVNMYAIFIAAENWNKVALSLDVS